MMKSSYVMPVPAPATAEILVGVPLAACDEPGELTTPTGAAILTTLADGYGPLPPMQIECTGYGAGSREGKTRPNVFRVILGESADDDEREDQVVLLETNLDDATGEQIGYASERLFAAGAFDVFTTPIAMKKNRPGVKLSVLCRPQHVEQIEAVLFTETTTLGVRRFSVSRHVLSRGPHSVETRWGPVDGKVGWLSESAPRFAPEFESCRRIAAQHDVPLRDVYEAAQKAFDPAQVQHDANRPG